MGLINIAEAARVANCSDKTLRRAIELKELVAQPRERANQPIMIAVEDLQSYMEARHGVQLEVTEVKPIPPAEKPSRSGSDSALVDRIAELEQTIQRMQEDRQNDQLLGGHDYLALGPMDDVHYQNRMDALELENTRLSGRVVALEDTLKETLTRLAQLEKDQAGDIATLTGQLSRTDAKIGARLDHDSKRMTDIERALQRLSPVPDMQEVDAFFTRNPGMQALVDRERERIESKGTQGKVELGQEKTTSPESSQLPTTYEGEWTITGANDAVVFHDVDSQRARRRLESLVTNSPGKRYSLHRPVFTPSSGLATEVTEGLPEGVHKQLKLSTGEVVTFRDDFNTPLLVSYRCEAVHKDVDASLVVGAHRGSEQGTYTLGWTKWGKTNPVGREGPNQSKRAQVLLATLEDRTRQEMRRSGWVEVGQSEESTLWRKLPENTRLM